MLPEANFNAIAKEYDDAFTGSIIGKLQRKRVWKFTLPYLEVKKKLSVLEINCGTGTDALWMAEMGHRVVATDVAAEMINVAQTKAGDLYPDLNFEVCAFDEAAKAYGDRKFDVIFSDFAGLNCIDRKNLVKLQHDFAGLLKPGGKLIMVLLGKKCWVERIYFTWRGEQQKARRRKQSSVADLGNNSFQPVYCYEVSEVKEIFSAFSIREVKPVGIFIPPSYLEPLMKRNGFVVSFVHLAERIFGRFSWLGDYADHTFMVLEKK